MASQIASTPVLKGAAATAVLKEMQRKPSLAAKKGAEVLTVKFSAMVKK